MQSQNKKAGTGAIVGILFLFVTAYPTFAADNTTDNSNSTASNTSNPQVTTGDSSTTTAGVTSQTTTGGIIIPSSSTSTASTLSTVSTASSSTLATQVTSWSSSSTLSPPTCNGGCIFAVTRVSPTNSGSGTNLEAVVGITIPIGSNDNGAGEVNRLNAEMQKYRTEHEIKLALSEKLAEALESGRMERARVIAIMLAPLLGYKDYQSLLIVISSPKPTNLQIGKR
ncbi:hypothetical protein [Chamaesiphon sp. OTE_75_metabat_556]|uniref:hypothetical protein n=1 Tax=Chamaesiphon sp. OTE_75_metabat_556 TaxID=2964692 RepID=UPI00286AF55C|nr:hypothetical protein [Chamaesiphon sp. OTE_75_metabat_556]